MKNISFEQTKYTPAVIMDVSGKVSMIGKSYPENTFEFYKPILGWVKDYFVSETSPKQLSINIEITYFNSSSSKIFFDFFDLLNDNKDTFELRIVWVYDQENESAFEAGEDFMHDFPELAIELQAKTLE